MQNRHLFRHEGVLHVALPQPVRDAMCLIAFAWRNDPRFRLALIANRDEAHARPTAAAGWDPDASGVYGGRDLVQHGSWLQCSTQGRLAAVTNVRAGIAPEDALRSRGHLVRDWVRGRAPGAGILDALAQVAEDYGRFNLLALQGGTLAFATNHPRFATHGVEPGLHAMSNGAFDAPWPKSTHATRALDTWLRSDAAGAVHGVETGGAMTFEIIDDRARDALAPLFDALRDTQPAPDYTLPDTGVAIELERVLSPAFISGATYGTRCSTVVLLEDARAIFAERRYGPEGRVTGQSCVAFPFDARIDD